MKYELRGKTNSKPCTMVLHCFIVDNVLSAAKNMWEKHTIGW